MRTIVTLSVAMLSILLSTCKQATQPDNGGQGIIVPGEGVEGIKLGDLKETVVAKLGNPTSVGWADGIYRSWRAYFYDEGSRVNPIMKIHFCFIDSGVDYGPLDEISIGPAYKGRTKEGIGVGSLLSQVHQAYGSPDRSLNFPQQNWIDEAYCINQHMFQIHYEDSIVTACSIGYFIPMPEYPLYPCR